MAQLLGPDGRPITVQKKMLTEEVARPGLTSVRQAWSTASAVSGLTPDRLAAILRQADQGDMDALLTLAEEMEERDPHYGSVLATRKLAVLGLDRRVAWASGQEDHPLAEEIQEACQGLIEAPEFDDLLEHLLDALGKPYAAPEILWDTTSQWRPRAYEHRDPRWFQFDRETGRELRLKESGHADGMPLPPFKFAVHTFGRKSGLPARLGLARLVAFSFVCKLYGLKDWMAYAEIFGIPLRLGKYDAAAKPEDVEVLKRAVFNLGSDAAAVIPQAMTIEFPTASGGVGNADLFERLVTFVDNQISKAVLGQTGTTDMQKGGGYAQASVLNEVRGDLLKADARSLGKTTTRAVLEPFVAFNWGPDAPVPRVELVVEEPEDVKVLGEALERLVPLGLKVGQAEVRKKLRLSEPAADDELLTPPAQAAAPAPIAPGAKDPAIPRDPAGRDTQPALARERVPGANPDDQVLDELTLAALDGWAPAFGREAAAVMKVVAEAASFEEVTAGLQALASDLASPLAARSLARAMFEAAVIGGDRTDG